MSGKRRRVIGTTDQAIDKAENELNAKFPPSFRAWLIQNNGLGIEGITIFPVFDDRDARKTWYSIVRNYQKNWMAWLDNFEDEEKDFSHLLPFGDFGTGDFYCFDYGQISSNGEVPVVRWSHETGETENRGRNFEDFLEKLKRGDFDFD